MNRTLNPLLIELRVLTYIESFESALHVGKIPFKEFKTIILLQQKYNRSESHVHIVSYQQQVSHGKPRS